MGYRWSDVRILSPRPSPHDFHLQTNRMGRLRPVKGRMMDDQTRRVRIVIADDESIIRMDLREMLMHVGYDVIGEAADGRTAIDLAQKFQPDLVVMDIKMPDLDGIEAAARLTRERLAPVVLLTAYSEQNLIGRAKSAGVSGY